MTKQPLYTTDSIANHIYHAYSNVLRYNPASSSFEEAHGIAWIPITSLGVERYIQAALCSLLSHAMDIGEGAAQALHALDNPSSFAEISTKAAQLLNVEGA